MPTPTTESGPRRSRSRSARWPGRSAGRRPAAPRAPGCAHAGSEASRAASQHLCQSGGMSRDRDRARGRTSLVSSNCLQREGGADRVSARHPAQSWTGRRSLLIDVRLEGARRTEAGGSRLKQGSVTAVLQSMLCSGTATHSSTPRRTQATLDAGGGVARSASAVQSITIYTGRPPTKGTRVSTARRPMREWDCGQSRAGRR
jgi:hypothetical protein